NSKGKKRRPGSKSLAQALKCNDPLFLDFIARCLVWDPEKRLKPREGLQHEWISDIRTPVRSLFSPPHSAVENTLNSSVGSIGSNGSMSARRRSIMFTGQPSGSISSRPIKVKTESELANTTSGSIRSSGRTLVSASISGFSGGSQSMNGSSHNQEGSGGSGYGHHKSSSTGSNHADVANISSSSNSKYGSHYTNLYPTPSSTSSAHTISSATSRRMTVGGSGDMSGSGASSYYGGSS
ncbi:hypothetical protein BGZ65_013002, partial [Modicella reniformis]